MGYRVTRAAIETPGKGGRHHPNRRFTCVASHPHKDIQQQAFLGRRGGAIGGKERFGLVICHVPTSISFRKLLVPDEVFLAGFMKDVTPSEERNQTWWAFWGGDVMPTGSFIRGAQTDGHYDEPKRDSWVTFFMKQCVSPKTKPSLAAHIIAWLPQTGFRSACRETV